MSGITHRYYSVDETLGHLQVTVDVAGDTSLTELDENAALLASLQYLYTIAVWNFGGREAVDKLLRETLEVYGEDYEN